jgi:hypothetical protein
MRKRTVENTPSDLNGARARGHEVKARIRRGVTLMEKSTRLVRRVHVFAVALWLCASACRSLESDETSQPTEELATAATAATDYTLFEADPVRPVAVLEASGWVAVANTPDDFLEIFQPSRRGVRSCARLKVGMRPVAVAVVREERARATLWVVNHLSDSISVVELDLNNCRVELTRTLQVGDEPRDIVVARTRHGRARVFVATAHRGQHHPLESARLAHDLIVPPDEKQARGMADVLVFDPDAPGAPPRVVNVFANTPRALAVGNGVVYAASYLSGNRTTAIPAETVTARGVASLNPMLARDADGRPVERDGELVLLPGVAGKVRFEGGLPAVAGSGRCVSDPRDDDGELLGVCVVTDAERRVQRAIVQRPGAVDPVCQCTSGDGTLQPTTGVIVQFFATAAACGADLTTFPDGTSGCWLDRAPRPARTPAGAADRKSPPMAWNGQVRFSLPDEDVFAIGVDDLQVSASFSGVGTIVFGLAVQPGTGKVFATNTDANNLTRFEGRGEHASSTVLGHLHESRITVIDPARAAVSPVHLNTHINYDHCCERVPGENERSFAFPVAGVFSATGDRFYFAALGSDKVGVVSAAALASGFDQLQARARGQLREIVLGDDVAEPAGPVGLALDARRDRLYVKTHFSNELVVIDTDRERIADRERLPSPEPAVITRGRSILYNARLTSSHGDSACASCHAFGDFDGLAWDLGDPDGASVHNPGPFVGPTLDNVAFRSNKGPMTTQTLRGLANHGPMHWRGDRTRNFQDRPAAQPDVGPLDELNSFGEFDVAIAGLNGNHAPLDPAVFQRFTRFALELTFPPNPVRHLDDRLTPDQEAARALYFGCAELSDEQLQARRCVAMDGTVVNIDAADRECVCARNPAVAVLGDVPTARGLGEILNARLGTGSFRADLDALAADAAGLPPPAVTLLAALRAELDAGVTELLGADTTLTARGLLPARLGSALRQISEALNGIIDLSLQNGGSVAERLVALFNAAIPPDVRPPGVSFATPRDLVQLFERIRELVFFNQLAAADEALRGTPFFRNLLADCDLSAAPVCRLRVTDSILTCNGCHRLDAAGNASFGVAQPGFFGTAGEYTDDGESQIFKIPHLRNQYQKTGMFGAAFNPFFVPESVLGPRKGGFFASDNRFTGPQVRGFGFFHDGITDTLQRFHGAVPFVRSGNNPGGLELFLPDPATRAACVQRFRAATAADVATAPPELRPFVGLCVASGPLPELCFTDPDGADCRAALVAVAAELGQPDLPRIFADGILPLCFQLGSMLEAGSEQGVCYPSGLRERAQMESFMLAFDSNLKPMVGQQLTVAPGATSDPALRTLLASAHRGHCDVALRQANRGYLMTRPEPDAPERSRLRTRDGDSLALRDLSRRDGPVTFTCYPPRANQAEARRSAFSR